MFMILLGSSLSSSVDIANRGLYLISVCLGPGEGSIRYPFDVHLNKINSVQLQFVNELAIVVR